MVILITGTSRGIGKYLSESYLERGHVVIGCSRSECTIDHEHYTHFNSDISEKKNIIDI